MMRRTPDRMTVLHSDIDPRSAEFASNAAAMRGAGRRPARTRRGGRTGRWQVCTRTAPRPQQTAAAPASGGTDRSRLTVPGTVATGSLWPVRQRSSSRGHRHRCRPCVRTRVHHHRQRCDSEGRHLFSAHREEAPSRAGDRPPEPIAVYLPGRFRWRVPADAGRDLPGSRSFRPHLLQSGEPVGAGHSADRRGDGFMHRGWRIRSRHERRNDHRPQARHDLSRRSTAWCRRQQARSSAPKIWAAPTCTRAPPASSITMRAMMAMRSRCAAASSPA